MSESYPIEIDVHTAKQLIDSEDDCLLLDVRQPDEFETAKIDGSKLIPMGELRDRLSELDGNRDSRIIVHCHHGGRSMRVTEALRSAGFEKVQNMAGGIDAWSLEIDDTVPRY